MKAVIGCKMATGSGKTIVMAMLAAWSVINKAQYRQDKRFSDAVLIVCPNLTIRESFQCFILQTTRVCWLASGNKAVLSILERKRIFA